MLKSILCFIRSHIDIRENPASNGWITQVDCLIDRLRFFEVRETGDVERSRIEPNSRGIDSAE